MAIHKLKTPQPYFDDIMYGKKTFDVRNDDRNFQIADRLDLFEGNEEINDDDIYRQHIHVFVKYKLEGGQFGIQDGFCVLGISHDE